MGGGGGGGKAFVLEQLTNYIAKSSFLNKGDILVFDGDNIVVQPVGADETVLTANSATDTGLSYSEAASSDYQSITVGRDGSDYVNLITRADTTTVTISRDGNNRISSFVDTATGQTMTVSRDGNNLITGVAAS